MSCELLGSKSSIMAQILAVKGLFSFKVFFRYSMIVLISFLPLTILYYNSILKIKLPPPPPPPPPPPGGEDREFAFEFELG